MTGYASAAPEVTPHNWEQVVSQGDRVPYDGVLVPEDAYRFYQVDSLAYPDCKDKLKAASVAYASCSAESWFTQKQINFFLAGFVLGAVAASQVGR